MISAITTTANRPVAFALCERWMARQTVQPDEWVVADGGEEPSIPTLGQRQIWSPTPPGPRNLGQNLLNALAIAKGDILVFFEDDDWYRADHIERMLELFDGRPNTMAVGDYKQRYYNLPQRLYRGFHNVGASLCQTAIKREALQLLWDATCACMGRNHYGIDTTFWRAMDSERYSLGLLNTVIGMKGLPGQPGLGIGHRPSGRGWTPDEFGDSVLRAWIGVADAQIYADILGGTISTTV